MKVAIYIRVSTQEQAIEGYSIGAQTERLKAYCTARDWKVVNIYTDPGFSGSNINRPAMQEMIKDVEKERIDLVLVYKLDRLSRSQKDTLYLIEDVFLKHNVNFVSVNENFDTTTAFGRAMIGILSVFAQLEREQIRERTMMGRAERAKSGYFHGGGFDPIGYDYVDGELIINEYEAKQVREVFDLFLKGTPISKIQKIMIKKGYTTKYSGWQHTTSVRSTLTTPVVNGRILYQGELYDGRHEAIIDDETFSQAQKLYNARKWTHKNPHNFSRPFTSVYLLTGLLVCANCGAKYFAKGNYSGHGENRNYRAYYTCYSRGKSAKKFVNDPNCKNPTYPTKKLDELITAEIKKLAFNPDYLNDLRNEDTSEVKSNANDVLQKRIVEIDNQYSKLLDLYQNSPMGVDKVLDRMEQLNNEKESLEKELESQNDQPTALSIQDTHKLLTTADTILDGQELAPKKALLMSLIDRIEVGQEKDDFTIYWKFN